MNWGRAKTILIIMFLVTDIFLLMVLMRTKIETLQIPQKTIAETVEILSSKGISIRQEQIPSKRVENQNVIMKNFFQNPQEAAGKILGQEAELISSVPEQYTYQFESPKGALQIQDNGFRFQSNKVPMVESTGTNLSNSEISNAIVSMLTKHGFIKGTVFLYNMWEKEGVYHCDAMPVYDGTMVYGISMHLTADREEVLSMEGHWFEPVEVEHNKEEMLLDVTAVLAGMALSGTDGSTEIAQVNHGFYASADFLNSREFAAVPIYVVTDREGNTYKFDARVGTKVE